MSAFQARFSLRRGDFVLDVDLALPERGISALFGPSGSGKTTCLRAIAGLETGAHGHCALDDTLWQDTAHGIFVPPHRRPIGYVFQEASLFAHLSVRGNLAYGQKRRRPTVERARLAAELADTAALLGIAGLLERMPASLSGGERQRVAIARALLAAPRLLLMDEPLAALDARRKQEILPYLERLHAALAIPVVYVSHAPDEVARLADHLVLLDAGRVVASGALHAILARPELAPLFAEDAGVVLDATLAAHEPDALVRLDFAGGSLRVAARPEALGQRLRCRILARDVSLARQPPLASSILNSLPGRIAAQAPTETPAHILVRVDVGPTPILACITRRAWRELDLAVGTPVWAQIKAVALLAPGPASGANL